MKHRVNEVRCQSKVLTQGEEAWTQTKKELAQRKVKTKPSVQEGRWDERIGSRHKRGEISGSLSNVIADIRFEDRE